MPIQPGGGAQTFAQQFQQLMYYIGPVVQIVYMIGLVVIAFLAYREFKRLVDSKIAHMAGKASGAGGGVAEGAGAVMAASPAGAPSARDTEDIAVDEFAE